MKTVRNMEGTKMSKACQKCKVDKELTAFYKQTKAQDGLQHWCKECMNQNNRDNKNKRLLEGPSIVRDAKVCNDCNLRKPINQFYTKRGYSADGYGSYCKTCWVKRITKSQNKHKI